MQSRRSYHPKPKKYGRKSFEDTTDLEKLAKLACLGFLGDSRQAQFMKKMIAFQFIALTVFLYFWYQHNGGLWPKFLGFRVSPDVDLVDHFVFSSQDGSDITWGHGANDKTMLEVAIENGAMMLEGDVVLQNHKSPGQLLPVMSHDQHTDADMTLKDWMSFVSLKQKGMKLDFKSTDAADLSMQMIHDMSYEVNGPVHLSAVVADGPNGDRGDAEIIDPQTFFKSCKRYMPKSTLSLSWRNDVYEFGDKRYNWTVVKNMYDIIESNEPKQPINFNVRGVFAKPSLAPLKWLMDMTQGSLTIYSKDESLGASDLIHIRRSLPKEKVYFDLAGTINEEFKNAKQSNEVIIEQDPEFTPSQWSVVKGVGDVIYMSKEAVVLRRGYLLSTSEYFPTETKHVVLTGKIEFLPAPNSHESVKRGATIYMRAKSTKNIDSGVAIFIGDSGRIEVVVGQQADSSLSKEHLLAGFAPCYSFRITDGFNGNIEVAVSRPPSCDDYSVVESKVVTTIPVGGISSEAAHIGFKSPDDMGFLAVEQLKVL